MQDFCFYLSELKQEQNDLDMIQKVPQHTCVGISSFVEQHHSSINHTFAIYGNFIKINCSFGWQHSTGNSQVCFHRSNSNACYITKKIGFMSYCFIFLLLSFGTQH